MIFVGDIALPYKDAVKTKGFAPSLMQQEWFGNLEGAILDDDDSNDYSKAVFNHKSAIKKLCNDFSFAGFSLANNHIYDIGSVDKTLSFLKEKKIPHGGVGLNIEEANQPIVLFENGKQIVIINFGWEVIQCKVTLGEGKGVNPLRRKHVINTVKNLIIKYPHAAVIPFMHWSYELEPEPQPFERELAKLLIDLGVDGVIGCHPHRIGGFELHEGKPIVYSLGNWMFKQDYYHNGFLRFPSFCDKELAFEWCFETNEFKFHFFNFDPKKSNLTYSHTEDKYSRTMRENTPFKNLSNDDYKKWYRKNHFHKNKGLPVYYWEDNQLTIAIKNSINKLRDFTLQLILRLR